MFDVASGECELLDFLLTRFNPLDLKTKINLAPSCIVDEMLAPKKPVEDEPAEAVASADPPPRQQIFVADTRDRRVTETEPEPSKLDYVLRNQGVAAPEELDTVETGEGEEEEAPDEATLSTLESQPVVAAAPPNSLGTPRGPDWMSLIEGFHAAAQRYQLEAEQKHKPGDADAPG